MNENEMKVYNELKEQIKRDSLRNHPIETLNQITPFYEQNIQQKDNSIVHNSQIQNLSAVTFEVNNSKLSKEKISQLMASKEKSKENVENLYEKEPLRKGPSQFEESFTRDIFSSPKYEEMAKNSTTAELNSKINERIENLKENQYHKSYLDDDVINHRKVSTISQGLNYTDEIDQEIHALQLLQRKKELFPELFENAQKQSQELESERTEEIEQKKFDEEANSDDNKSVDNKNDFVDDFILENNEQNPKQVDEAFMKELRKEQERILGVKFDEVTGEIVSDKMAKKDNIDKKSGGKFSSRGKRNTKNLFYAKKSPNKTNTTFKSAKCDNNSNILMETKAIETNNQANKRVRLGNKYTKILEMDELLLEDDLFKTPNKYSSDKTCKDFNIDLQLLENIDSFFENEEKNRYFADHSMVNQLEIIKLILKEQNKIDNLVNKIQSYLLQVSAEYRKKKHETRCESCAQKSTGQQSYKHNQGHFYKHMVELVQNSEETPAVDNFDLNLALIVNNAINKTRANKEFDRQRSNLIHLLGDGKNNKSHSTRVFNETDKHFTNKRLSIRNIEVDENMENTFRLGKKKNFDTNSKDLISYSLDQAYNKKNAKQANSISRDKNIYETFDENKNINGINLVTLKEMLRQTKSKRLHNNEINLSNIEINGDHPGRNTCMNGFKGTKKLKTPESFRKDEIINNQYTQDIIKNNRISINNNVSVHFPPIKNVNEFFKIEEKLEQQQNANIIHSPQNDGFRFVTPDKRNTDKNFTGMESQNINIQPNYLSKNPNFNNNMQKPSQNQNHNHSQVQNHNNSQVQNHNHSQVQNHNNSQIQNQNNSQTQNHNHSKSQFRSQSENNRYQSLDKNLNIEKYKNQPPLIGKLRNHIDTKSMNVSGQIRDHVRNSLPKDMHLNLSEQKKVTSLRNVPATKTNSKGNSLKKRFSLYGDLNFSNTYNMSVV